MAAPGVDLFDEYFRRADLDRDGRISGAEAVAFFQGSNLPKPVLAQVWTYADQNRIGYLGRQEFYNALKLVTVAQSGRTLTPEIVKSALLGPAASKIPAPKINPVPSAAPPINSISPALPTNPTLPTNSVLPSSSQFGSIAAIAPNNLGVRPTQTPQNTVANQQFLATVNSSLVRPTKAAPTSTLTQMHSSLPGGGSLSGVNQPSSNPSNLSSNWLGGAISGGSVGFVSQNSVKAMTPSQNSAGFGATLPGITGVSPRPQTQSALASSIVPKALDVFSSSTPTANQQRSPVVSGNGLSSDSIFGGDIFSANSQVKSNAVNFMASMSTSATTTLVAAGSQNLVRPGQLASAQNSLPGLPSAGQHQWPQSNVKQNQTGNLGPNITLVTPGVSPGPASSASDQNQLQWPKISQSDIKKYTKVFADVDKDRDGKITGVEARNLFLSWRLPREVLKQVWDLSDQDNDSMLSLREFCIALYLMERYREGGPLPEALPSSLMYDETLLRVTSLPSGALGVPAWQPGLQQQMLSGSRTPVPVGGVRPLMQNSATFLADGTVQSAQQISGAPALENHMMNRLVKEKQTTDMNHLEAPEPVQEVEKQILDSREKIEFYRTKMQDLVLYKSRCDNRLNEITERASADRREVELLAKKYEEKYKQVGELASKLAVEEARNRDIQERKMELHNAIIKMEQGGSADGLLQVRVDRIQSDLEELEKALIDRCKQHSVNVKATTSVELPFGWQPVPQEGAAVWDENWDKFEDEGFTVVKDLTDFVNTPTAKPTSPSFWSDKASDDFSPVASSSIVDEQIEKSYATKEQMNGSAYDHSEEGSTRSPRSSSGRSTFESPFNSLQFGTHDMSPSSKERHNDQVGAESTVFSGDKYSDEPWTFDDSDSVWGSSTLHVKEGDHGSSPRNTFFTSNDFGSMKVDSPSASSVYGKEKQSPFFEDSVPSSPVFNSSSPSKFNDSRDDHSFNNFGRFDSFSTDSGLFPARDGLSRFDSMSSNQPEGLSRFDSISSSRDFGHNRAFESFDDADPFGSTGPFRASGDHSPKRNSDNWRAF